MESLKNTAALLRKQLADIQAKISEIEGKPVVYIRDKVSNMRSSKKWKEFVNKYGVVENVISLMEMSYDSFHENIDADGDKVTAILGELGSDQWNKFIVKVFRHMVKEGTFDKDGEYESFEDTANGCDEILWDASVEVLENLLENGKENDEDE